MPTISEYLDECYREEFARVVAAWELRNVRKQVVEGYGWYDGEHDAVTLRLSNERGCTACEIRPRGEERFIYVPEFFRLASALGKKSSSFEPDRRRYTLREQCEMLIERKDDVIRVATPALADERRALKKKFDAAYMAQFSPKG